MIVPLVLGALAGVILASATRGYRDWRLVKARPDAVYTPDEYLFFNTQGIGEDFIAVMLENTVTGARRPTLVRVLGPTGSGQSVRFVYYPNLPTVNKEALPFTYWEAWMPKEGETAVVSLDHVLED